MAMPYIYSTYISDLMVLILLALNSKSLDLLLTERGGVGVPQAGDRIHSKGFICHKLWISQKQEKRLAVYLKF